MAGDMPQVIQDLITVLNGLGGMVALDAAVQIAKKQLPDLFKAQNITNASTFITWITSFLTWIPTETTDSKQVYDMICIFYFVFDQAPLLTDQTPVNPSSVGKPLTPLSAWIVEYAQSLGDFMNNTTSYSLASFATFQAAPLYRTFECISPNGTAFQTFNQFFGRQLAPGARQIIEPGDNTFVTYPADSAYDNAFAIDSGSNTFVLDEELVDKSNNTITAKGLTWSIEALLQNSQYASAFANGVWVHSFLSTFNYHRLHAPVSGTVVEARVIQQAAYLDVIAEGGLLIPRRKIDPTSGAVIEAEDLSGYQFLQTRGLFVIDTSESKEGDIGLVAVLPIGMAQVSSVVPSVSSVSNPQLGLPTTVEKGHEIAYFQFGGSDIVTVFQPNAGLTPTSFNSQPSPGTEGKYTFYGQLLANAKPTKTA